MPLMQYFTIYGHTEITVMDTYLYTFSIFVGFSFLIYSFIVVSLMQEMSFIFLLEIDNQSRHHACLALFPRRSIL